MIAQVPRITVRYFDPVTVKREGDRFWYTALGRRSPLQMSPYIDGKQFLYVVRDGKVTRVIGEIIREGQSNKTKPDEIFQWHFRCEGGSEKKSVARADPAKGERELVFDFEDRGVWFVDTPGAYINTAGNDTYLVYRRFAPQEMLDMVPLVEQGLEKWRNRPRSNIMI